MKMKPHFRKSTAVHEPADGHAHHARSGLQPVITVQYPRQTLKNAGPVPRTHPARARSEDREVAPAPRASSASERARATASRSTAPSLRGRRGNPSPTTNSTLPPAACAAPASRHVLLTRSSSPRSTTSSPSAGTLSIIWISCNALPREEKSGRRTSRPAPPPPEPPSPAPVAAPAPASQPQNPA